tara:strand:+ start:170 stop:427 length:258 start_codon:yes stop_codon:yes gene_type:complete
MVKSKYEADSALMEALRLMTMIIRTEDNVSANKATVKKAQRRYDALVQLMAELILLDGNVLTDNLASRIAKKTSEATRFYYHPNA